MTSRERVLASINHQNPDQLPMDLGAHCSAGISGEAYAQLKKYLGINHGHTRIYDVVQQVALPEIEVLDIIGADVLDVGRVFNTEDSDWYNITMRNGLTAQWPVWFKPIIKPDGSWDLIDEEGTLIGRKASDGICFDQQCFPYEEDFPEDYSDFDKGLKKVIWNYVGTSPWDHITDEGFWEKLRERCLVLRNSTDRALMITTGGHIFEQGTYCRGMLNFLMDIYEDEEGVLAFNEQVCQRHMVIIEKVCRYLGDVVDILRIGDDLGMDNNMFMAKEKYQQLFKPFHRRMCDYVHRHSSMKMLLHSCGSIYPIISDLIDAGFEILNPVQTTANGMDPARLKKEFGRDITFWGGGCNTRRVLNLGTPKEVYEYSRRMIDIFFQDGGFVFNQEHNILGDVPPENIMAMYKAVEDARRK